MTEIKSLPEQIQEEEKEIHDYGDPNIRSANAPIGRWLKATYVLLPIWGIIWFWFFWNGSYGWLDRGYWHQLQEAANTTIPQKNMNVMDRVDMDGSGP